MIGLSTNETQPSSPVLRDRFLNGLDHQDQAVITRDGARCPAQKLDRAIWPGYEPESHGIMAA